jgi:hypothetical protein
MKLLAGCPAPRGFDAEVRLKDAWVRERLGKMVTGYLDVGRKLLAA